MRTAEQIAYEVPEPTPERLARLDDWVEFYVASVRESWAEQGTNLESTEAKEMLAWIPDDVRCIDIPEWMPILPAIMYVSYAENMAPAMGAEVDRDKYRNAMRTVKSASQDEHDAAICYQMGWDQLSLNQFREKSGRAPIAGHCALYRYFDADGRLLYVGIAKDPNMRDDQHRANSKWHRFQVRRTVEWHSHRRAALDAERDAVRDESPIFNLTHASPAQKRAAMDYLFDQVGRAS